MKVGILGSGIVGQTLARGFLSRGNEVMVGTRKVEKLKDWHAKNKNGKIGSFSEAAQFGEILVLAVKGLAALDVLKSAGVENLEGKVVIDTTNPIADSPQENGVLKFFTTLDESLMERLQMSFEGVKFVKAFNSIGNAAMVDPSFSEKPTMFICGNDSDAKSTVSGILDDFGFEVEDMGGVEAARAIEPLCILWCIPGFLRNEWQHAFRLLKK